MNGVNYDEMALTLNHDPCHAISDDTDRRYLRTVPGPNLELEWGRGGEGVGGRGVCASLAHTVNTGHEHAE